MDSAWISGGSASLSKNLTSTYQALGGKVHCNSPVANIITSDTKATGIILENGTKILGDYIIPACDTFFTLNKLLRNKFTNQKFTTLYNTPNIYTVSSFITVAFGVDCDLSHYPHNLNIKVDPFIINHQTYTSLYIQHYCHEKGFPPTGKSIIKLSLTDSDFESWKKLSITEYKALKSQFIDILKSQLTTLFPETNNHIEMINMVTPLTYVRYCNAYKGS